jgi:hypothetical protein
MQTETDIENARNTPHWLRRFVRPTATFRQIYDAVNPDEPQHSWCPSEKTDIVKRVRCGQIKTPDSLLLAMQLMPEDWTPKRKKEISALIWPNEKS